MLHSHKDHQVLFVGGPNTRKTNPRWRTAAILKNQKSAIYPDRFARSWRNLACWHTLGLRMGPEVEISNFWKPKTADSRHLEKLKNRHISAAFWAISTKFGRRRCLTLLSVPTVKNLKFPKPIWRRPLSWKNENRPYLRNGSTEIWHNDALWLSEGYGQLKFLTFKNPKWRRPPFWKIKNRPYLLNGSTDLREILHDDALWPSEGYWQLKFPTFENPRAHVNVLYRIVSYRYTGLRRDELKQIKLSNVKSSSGIVCFHWFLPRMDGTLFTKEITMTNRPVKDKYIRNLINVHHQSSPTNGRQSSD